MGQTRKSQIDVWNLTVTSASSLSLSLALVHYQYNLNKTEDLRTALFTEKAERLIYLRSVLLKHAGDVEMKLCAF